MLTHEFAYRGYPVLVTLIFGADRWRWQYVIAGGLPISALTPGFEHDDDALAEATADAKRRIDSMAPRGE